MKYANDRRVPLIQAISETYNKLSWTVDKSDPLMKSPCADEVIVLAAASESGQYVIIGCMYA